MTTRYTLFTKEVFSSLLELEVRRSLRYQNFLSLLLMEATPNSSRDSRKDKTSFTDRIVSLISTQIRDTDLIGTAGENTISIVLLHSDKQSAVKVANRLNLLALSYMGPEESSQSHLNFGMACVPTHATDSGSLLGVAFETLEKSKAHSRFRVQAEPGAIVQSKSL
jgi:Diguanylate cyclase, GGDEF domain